MAPSSTEFVAASVEEGKEGRKKLSASLNSVAARKTFELYGAIQVGANNLQVLASILSELEETGIDLAVEEERLSLGKNKGGRSDEAINEALDRRRDRLREYAQFNWHVELKDNTSLGPMTLDEILQLPNTRSRRISQISVSNSSSATLHLSIRFRREVLLEALNYELRGQAALVSSFSQKIDDFVNSIRTPWSIMYGRYPFRIFLIALTSVALGVLAGVHFGEADSSTIAAASSLSSIAFFVLFLLLHFVAPWIFPICSFAIGKEEELIGHQKNTRWGILVATVVSLVTAWLFSRL